MQEDDLLRKIKHLFYGKVSYFQAVRLILELSLFDVFRVANSKMISVIGALFGVVLASAYAILVIPEKVAYLYLLFGSVGCLVMSAAINVVFGKGGFFSYMFYVGALPIILMSLPLVALISSFSYGKRYVSFRYDLPYNYSGRLTGVKGAGRKSR
ncbi:MAG: hypothetical protein CL602_01530 [Alteromonas sp.]|uniref:Uncharacterized protein n=1 Tax=Alteromonas australica TaxID=589873 RepID=A0A358DZX4_9ALTE|nr:hypothetical protein [Alteromonas australica]MBU32576.1 hypothetical protein [Alteromonas sp.]HBU51473.1 hypothetical protein [Alteromonas australica]|tara:strand:+ start:3356 stop:3820 length:465 start_codon:yes stop_codon:yes gene_type:complete